jgi:hypothetical protein
MDQASNNCPVEQMDMDFDGSTLSPPTTAMPLPPLRPPPRPLFHLAPSPNPAVPLFVDGGLDGARTFESELVVMKEPHK